MYKVTKIGDIDLNNYTIFAPEFVVHTGLAMIHYTLTCEFMEIVLYKQDLMEDFISAATQLKLLIRSCTTNSGIMNRW